MNSSYIIVIFGASGSGKTTLMEMLLESGSQYSIHNKYSDRPQRQYDDVELSCIKNFNPREFDYVYQTYGYKYGIQKGQIVKAIEDQRHHFIICNDISTIKALKRDYGEDVKTIFMFFDAPYEVLRDIQEKRNISDDEVNLRIAKTAVLYRQYAEETEIFDGSLPNYYKEDTSKLKRRLENLLIGFSQKSNVLHDMKAIEFSHINNKEYRGEIENYAFIIMPIRDEDHINIDVHEAIKRSCRSFEIKAERVDEIQYTGQITDKIQGCIELSKFVVADVTHERPNVYYEIGYADACNKPLILIAKYGEKIHFDLQGMNVLFYRGISHLEKLLKNSIKAVLKIT